MASSDNNEKSRRQPLDRTDQEFLDILVRLIDPGTSGEETESRFSVEQRIEARFKQLPWAVEWALIDCLHSQEADLFQRPPVEKFETASYTDASTDLSNRGTYYSGQSYLIDYSVSGHYVERRNKLSDHAIGVYGSRHVETWMRDSGLYKADDDNPDPHFAERAFVVNVLVPAYGPNVLARVRAGKEFPDYPYIVDFLLETAKGEIIIEVDGREYHDPALIGRERFENELVRQNRLQEIGYPVYRYAARRILQEPAAVIAELRQNIPSLVPMQSLLFEDDAAAESPAAMEWDYVALAEQYCDWFRPLQLALLLALSRSIGSGRFRILNQASPRGLVELALRDLSHLIDRLQVLYGVELAWPECLVAEAAEPIPTELLDRYLQATRRGPDLLEGKQAFATRHFSLEDECDGPRPDLIVDLRQEGRIPIVPEGEKPDVLGCESSLIGVSRARFDALTLGRPGERNSLYPVNLNKQLLDFFARRLLRVPSLYHHFDKERPLAQERQYESLCRVLSGKDTFAIMPTGRGKSAIFQLPAMLLPGSALVISPLRALMRDQVDDLTLSRGWNSVQSIRYDQRADVKEKAITDFIHGRANLLYVSPERLQEIKFSSRLAAAAASAHVSFVAIDEAHCVSEWGHDFRLSYMEIPYFLRAVRKQQGGVPCPILALTATASPPVQNDVCAILKLDADDVRDGGDLVGEANIDRTELSLSVHEVDGDEYPNNRQEVLCELLVQSISKALRHNHAFRWTDFANSGWQGKGAGVIFCLYKNPRGQTSWHDGVGAVRDHLITQRVIPDDQLRLYAADSPGFCPSCGRRGRQYYTIRNLPKSQSNRDGLMECVNGHRFTQADVHENWPQILAEVQNRFKKNEFPLLITTKAYGMGIDHRGLRFVVHYGLPSSLESYYQEIGRAGRDSKQAHCALLVRLPHEYCLSRYIDRPITYETYEQAVDDAILPPCLFGKSRTNRRCPDEIGLPEPCDLSRQLVMVLGSYQKPESFVKGCVEFWQMLESKRPNEVGRIRFHVSSRGPNFEKRLQRTQNYLLRLKQLGLVGRYKLLYLPRTIGGRTTFSVDFNIQTREDVTVDSLRDQLLKRLREIRFAAVPDTANTQSQKWQDALEEEFDGRFAYPGNIPPDRQDVAYAVGKLFSSVRIHVIKMRMESFAKLLRYVRSSDDCRRRELVGGMTARAHGDESYSCKFCDSETCVPDLSFDRERAEPAPDGLQYRDLFSSVDHTFFTQDFADVAKVMEEASIRGVVASLQHQATTHLESDPDNLAANLIAAEALAAKQRPDMHRYFRNFARVANVEQKDESLSLQGYQRYLRHDPAEAVRVFAIQGSAFDSREGLQRLGEDAKAAELDPAERDNLALAQYAETTKQAAGAFADVLSAATDFFD